MAAATADGEIQFVILCNYHNCCHPPLFMVQDNPHWISHLQLLHAKKCCWTAISNQQDDDDTTTSSKQEQQQQQHQC